MAHASLPPAERWRDQLAQKLLDVIVHVPATAEPASETPEARCRAIIRGAALKTAGTSGTLALPPGPWGMLTVLPDLVTVWKIQAQMVADITGAYGQTALLSPEKLLYCLFRQTASQAVRDLVVRLGDRLAIRRVPQRVLRRALRQIGLKIAQRLAGRPRGGCPWSGRSAWRRMPIGTPCAWDTPRSRCSAARWRAKTTPPSACSTRHMPSVPPDTSRIALPSLLYSLHGMVGRIHGRIRGLVGPPDG